MIGYPSQHIGDAFKNIILLDAKFHKYFLIFYFNNFML